MTHLKRLSIALCLSVAIPACGFPRPPAITDDATPAGDAAPGSDAVPGSDAATGIDAAASDAAISIDARPGTTIHVAGTGDDSNDGITAPVKTLKHAIGLAAANDQITGIVLASGRYESAAGETFPYTLPVNIILSGPAGGGAILAGTNTEPGMIVGAGALQDLELESFTVAVTATGTSRLTNLHIRTDMLAIRAESTARLTADNVDITGTVSACAAGIELNGSATLTSSMLATRNLKISVNAKDQSSLALSAANIVGDGACNAPFGVLTVTTPNVFSLANSLLDGGNIGIWFSGTGNPTQATVKDTTIRNMKASAIATTKVTLEVTGGELSNVTSAIGASGGDIKLTGVAIKHTSDYSVVLGDGGAFVMRRCTNTQNASGVYLLGNMAVDLGTDASPGNNVFQNGNATGVEIDAGYPGHVTAVGNTWRPSIQGGVIAGRCAARVVSGAVVYNGTSNYSVSASGSLQL
jgi:hypothetical protein